MRAIDADAMIDRLKEWDTKDKIDKALYNFTLNRINEQPTIQPAQPERIKGHWIYTGVKFPNWEGQILSEAICSECNGISYFRRAFDKYIGANICPNCGADMREVTE